MGENRRIKLFIDTVKVKCDTIFSPSEITPDPAISIPKPNTYLIKNYISLEKLYNKIGVTYHRQYLLKRITSEFQELLTWDFAKAYRLINHISGILHLNQIEISTWCIFLNRITENFFRPRLLAYFTAYQAKAALNSDMSIYEYMLNTKIPNFKMLFDNWQLVFDPVFEPSLREINTKYTEMLSRKKPGKNYKDMIELLMEMPRRKESIMSEQLTETSQVENMDMELTNFQNELLKGEKLSPIL